MNYIRLTQLEIDTIVAQHVLWITSGKTQGAKADFSGKEIIAYNFTDKNLQAAQFTKSHLVECTFQSTVLAYCNFGEAELIGCTFKAALMVDVSFVYSYVKACDFKEARALTIKAFSRSDITGSVFPKYIDFTVPTSRADLLIKKARNATHWTLAVCAIVIFSTLLKDSHQITLPFLFSESIDLDKNPDLIFFAILIFISGLFLNNSSCDMREAIHLLPSIFPDGRQSYATVYPWFIPFWASDSFYKNWTASKYPYYRHITRVLISNICNSLIFLALLCIIFKLVTNLNISAIYTPVVALITLQMWGGGIWISFKTEDSKFATYYTFGLAVLSLIVFSFFESSQVLLCYSFSLAIAWYIDRLITGNGDNAGLDMSVPMYERVKDAMLLTFKKYQLIWHFTNITLTVCLSFLIAITMSPERSLETSPFIVLK